MAQERRNIKPIPSMPIPSQQNTSRISQAAVPVLRKAPAEERTDDSTVQLYTQHSTTTDAFSLPERNKPMEAAHTTTPPFQLKGSNEQATNAAGLISPAQSADMQSAFQLKEASTTGNVSVKPIQRMVKYEFNPMTNKFFNVKYIRGNQPLSLIGKMHGKHTTADASQAAVYELGLEGRTLVQGLAYLTDVTRAYLNMPGNYLIDFHMNQTGNIGYNYKNEGIPQAFNNYFELQKKLHTYSMLSSNLVQQYEGADEQGRQALSFQMFAMVNNITYNLGEFRDVLPLVSLYSKGERGGKEKEAKASLYDAERLLREGGDVDNETKKRLKLELMDHFDLAAIDMIYDTSEERNPEAAYEKNLREALNWLDIDVLATKVVDMDTGVVTNVKVFEKIAGQIVADMIQNHIAQMYVSYPNVAKAVNFQDFSIADMKILLQKKNFANLNDEVERIYEEGNVDMWEEEAELVEGEGEGEGEEGENAHEADSDSENEYHEEVDSEDDMDQEIIDINNDTATYGLPATTKEDRKKAFNL
ncbi:hypothetical protein [Chitinophaga rhizophila]|uniref:Uncharacterized protein n=1 Tax=Chitinophaga rhizophila TaxID=2866212 RepID=A0ABS7GL08_9BACT|nr:hypothetical protein [Chitinophaga rhizophila]MBW8687976.1 hypothetical protein [Chitinophaga rhizophila]